MKVLYAMSEQCYSDAALHHALHRCVQGAGSLVVLYAAIPDVRTDVPASLVSSNRGHERSSQPHVRDRHFGRDGQTQVAKAERQARSHGVGVEGVMVQGSFAATVISQARERQVDLVTCGQKKRSFFTRIFRGSELHKLQKGLDCEVRVFEGL